MSVFILGIVALLMWWYWARLLPERREIVGCVHDHGTLKETVPNAYGKMTALTWYCRDCPFQVQLLLNRYNATTLEGYSVWINPGPRR